MDTSQTSREDSLFVEKVLRARQMPPEKKFLLGPRMYEYARSIAMAAIRAENPNATPEEHRREFQRRQRIQRWIEENPG
jgi:hypothetical protein